jgi:transmembrane sensor
MTNDFKVLLQRFHDHTITPGELAKLRKLLDSGMYNEYWGNNFFGSLCEEPRTEAGEDKIPLDRAYRRIYIRTQIDTDVKPVVEPAPRKKGPTLRFWVAAAAITALALMATVWVLINKPGLPYEEALTVIHGPLRFQLPDRSRVLLDDRTTLAYHAPTYGNENREVLLTGQAFFEVIPDTSLPFIVRSGKVSTIVLGTSFNVNARPRKNNIVTVSEGKVEVHNGEDWSGHITPGEQIMVNQQSHTVLKRTVIADTVLTWRNRYLIFDKIPLGEAMQRIEERFNITVHFTDEALTQINIDAAFVAKEDMEMQNVFKVLGTIANITFKVDDEVVTVSAKELNSLTPR